MANHTNYERDKENIMKWQKENIDRVVINLKKADKERWTAYAESKGKKLATLIRELMEKEMNS